MKKVIALMSVIGLLAFTNLNSVMAQDAAAATDPAAQTEITDDSAAVAAEEAVAEPVAAVADEVEDGNPSIYIEMSVVDFCTITDAGYLVLAIFLWGVDSAGDFLV